MIALDGAGIVSSTAITAAISRSPRTLECLAQEADAKLAEMRGKLLNLEGQKKAASEGEGR